MSKCIEIEHPLSILSNPNLFTGISRLYPELDEGGAAYSAEILLWKISHHQLLRKLTLDGGPLRWPKHHIPMRPRIQIRIIKMKIERYTVRRLQKADFH